MIVQSITKKTGFQSFGKLNLGLTPNTKFCVIGHQSVFSMMYPPRCDYVIFEQLLSVTEYLGELHCGKLSVFVHVRPEECLHAVHLVLLEQ